MTTTSIATSDETSITIRGNDLVADLIGGIGFTEMIYLLFTGRRPDKSDMRVLDACLVTLAEHGFTPGAIATRLIADAVPDQMQSAIAGGLLTVGGIYAGSMEGCAQMLVEAVAADDRDAHISAVVADHVARKAPIHGFGHARHKPDDPRSPALLKVAEEAGRSGKYVAALLAFGEEFDRQRGRHMTINATGAIAALLLEIGIEADIARGVALVSRTAGLVGHVLEEKQTRSARAIAEATRKAVPYAPAEN
ncbi:citryl-CoA lyase [Agaricicola taiwanensis]|uniref:citrate synthase (unknown stereospecificity) n=1 Tax=Agaricicola taiwanensis TaxID=591372 RepID=A0A8J2YB26_9RHOB|nr:citryl-CoA lyase [Agaricicola taiwanensis]GGE31075.1 citryl-CoA lyase [Agaricicola taiwanensis]